MDTNSTARWGTAAFVIGSIVGTFFFSGKRGGRRNEVFEEQQTVLDGNLTVPANATFGLVWPVIYCGTAGLVLHQALTAQARNPRYEQARPWFWASYALNALFGYFFSRTDKASQVGASLTTIAMLPTAIGLHRSLEIDRTPVARPERVLHRSVSLFAGWLTVATVVSAGSLVLEAGYRVRPAVAARWAFGILPFTAGLGMAVSRRLNDPYYLLPLVAAFAGVAAKQRQQAPAVSAVAMACALLTAGVAVPGIRRIEQDQTSIMEQVPVTDPAVPARSTSLDMETTPPATVVL